jgi:hypothetical protein
VKLRSAQTATQKTAWFILGRLREACGNQFDPEPLRGVVEVDETFVGVDATAGKRLTYRRLCA